MPNISNNTVERIKRFLREVNDTRGYSPEELNDIIDNAISLFTTILHDTGKTQPKKRQ